MQSLQRIFQNYSRTKFLSSIEKCPPGKFSFPSCGISSKPFGDYFSERKLAQFSFKITNAVISPIDLSPSEESIPESFSEPIYLPAG
ncbi:uncharacterized protein NPIL_34221 [Nephila pilipes]|uniref:Uncharacterized protein n=1 Tax=Nephila pilipes TaxID=299642 RepID=A0A8X6QU96_NEPPI|nr:uncharacterized protein NPIL_34221 [Nephila pilipes]